jgi:hypothetical protein
LLGELGVGELGLVEVGFVVDEAEELEQGSEHVVVEFGGNLNHGVSALPLLGQLLDFLRQTLGALVLLVGDQHNGQAGTHLLDLARPETGPLIASFGSEVEKHETAL